MCCAYFKNANVIISFTLLLALAYEVESSSSMVFKAKELKSARRMGNSRIPRGVLDEFNATNICVGLFSSFFHFLINFFF